MASLQDKPHDPAFVSREAELVFILTHMDGDYREKALGITEQHYEDKAFAKEWYATISVIVRDHPAAKAKLDRMYDAMTNDDYFKDF